MNFTIEVQYFKYISLGIPHSLKMMKILPEMFLSDDI